MTRAKKMGGKFALIIGVGEYEDEGLASLITPHADVGRLADILRSPEIGDFNDVAQLINEPASTIRRAIARFLGARKRDDLLLLYYSGHGVLDDRGHLYLTATDTERILLSATGIPAAFISDEMDRSMSRRQILILDCCHSGAFARGAKGALGKSVGTATAFEGSGYGRVVLTATDTTQYAWEGDQVIGQEQNSVFTHYLIDGLQTGAADQDRDGWISLDDLYNYVYEQIVAVSPKQTPGKWTYKQQGEIIIARNPRPLVEVVDLPSELQQAVESPFVSVREDAVRELDRLLKGSHAGLALAAQDALRRLLDDDSRRIAAAARASLDAQPTTTPQPPDLTKQQQDQSHAVNVPQPRPAQDAVVTPRLPQPPPTEEHPTVQPPQQQATATPMADVPRESTCTTSQRIFADDEPKPISATSKRIFVDDEAEGASPLREIGQDKPSGLSWLVLAAAIGVLAIFGLFGLRANSVTQYKVTGTAAAMQYEATNTAAAMTVAAGATTTAQAAEATGTAQAADATTTAQAAEAQAGRITEEAIEIFGPQADSLFSEESENIQTHNAGVDLGDLQVVATFTNPDNVPAAKWSYGFVFRRHSTGGNYRVYVTHENQWYLYLYRPDANPQHKTVAYGSFAALQTEPNQTNHLRLIVLGNMALFFINEQFVTYLDVSEWTQTGSVGVGTDFVREYQQAGVEIQYQDFSVYSLEPEQSAEATTTTQAAEAQAAKATATVQAAEAEAARLTEDAFQIFGPNAGSLISEDDEQIETSIADVDVDDFEVVATFTNPEDIPTAKWSYGFMFRKGTTNVGGYYLYVTSNRLWFLQLYRPDMDPQFKLVANGRSPALLILPDQTNRLHLIVKGNMALFFVNEQFVTDLDVSEWRQTGDVRIGTGFASEYQQAGAVTRYEDFSVYSLDSTHSAEATPTVQAIKAQATSTAETSGPINNAIQTSGPHAGSLTSENNGYIERYFADVNVRDFQALVTFTNPDNVPAAQWSYGITFRVASNGGGYNLFVRSDRRWSLDLYRPDSDPQFKSIASGTFAYLRTEPNHTNTFDLIVEGKTAFFRMNNQYIQVLDVSEWEQSGNVGVGTDFVRDYQQAGAVTQYRDFSVYSLDKTDP
jgi:hypothetical protein